MKKFLTVCLIVGLCLTLLGGGVFVAGMASAGWDLKALGSTKIEEIEYTETEPLTALAVDFENADIEISFSAETETAKLVYPQLQSKKGKNLSVVTLTQTGESLTLSEKIDEWKAGWWDLTSPKVKITLPASRTYALNIATENGDVTLSGEARATSLTLKTDNGNIKAENFTTESLNAETDNGNVILGNGVATGNVMLGSDNGDIRIGGTVRALQFQAETDCGDIEADGGLIDAETVLLNVDCGDVRAKLIGKQDDYTVTVETDAGNSNLSSSLATTPSSSRILKASADCGDIRISFSEA